MKIPSFNNARNTAQITFSALICAILLSACATTAPSSSHYSAQKTSSVLPAFNNIATTENTATSVAEQRSSTQRPQTGIDDVGPDAANVQINKAHPNKHFVLRPIGSDLSGDKAAERVGNDYIKIIGSYFPKVVYRKPQLNSKLLMRVAPGSTFPLEKLDDGWYQISTKQGSGYLRLQDGKPTNANI